MAKQWDIQRTTFTVGDFLSWQKAGALELSPSFQRRSVWTKPQKSYFVDTIYRGLPVPIIFVREKTDVDTLSTVREVVDGQQRLRTIMAYIDQSAIDDPVDSDEFTVPRKHNKDINGKRFAELDESIRKRILSYQLSVHVLPSDTSDSEVLSIFARMNSTGSKLNEQELRNAEYFGEFKIASYETAHANLERWRTWKIFPEQQIARMKEVELTSVLFIQIMDGLFERTQAAITRYYKKYDDDFAGEKLVLKEFSHVMEILEDSFGDQIATNVFQNSAMFAQLFHLVRRLEGASKPMTKARVRKILELGERIKERRNLPEDVLVSLASRFNRLSNQQIVADFLFDNASK
jgi:uncharacterized protein with ParB-like and HNH nuclease domain